MSKLMKFLVIVVTTFGLISCKDINRDDTEKYVIRFDDNNQIKIEVNYKYTYLSVIENKITKNIENKDVSETCVFVKTTNWNCGKYKMLDAILYRKNSNNEFEEATTLSKTFSLGDLSSSAKDAEKKKMEGDYTVGTVPPAPKRTISPTTETDISEIQKAKTINELLDINSVKNKIENLFDNDYISQLKSKYKSISIRSLIKYKDNNAVNLIISSHNSNASEWRDILILGIDTSNNSYSVVEVNLKNNYIIQKNTADLNLNMIISYINKINHIYSFKNSPQNTALVYKNKSFELVKIDMKTPCDFTYSSWPDEKTEEIANCLFKYKFIDNLLYK